MGRPIVILGDALQGGAANSTGRLIATLHGQGLPIERWHFTPQPPDAPAHYRSLDPRAKRPGLERVLKNIPRSWADRLRHQRHSAGLLQAVEECLPGLINVRNVHDCGINHDSLRALPRNLPLIWTMHDCWPFDGHAFTWSTHGKIEHAASDVAGAEERREQFFKVRPEVVLVSPSKWLAREAKCAVPSGIRVEVIPNGITTSQFKPLPKAAAKAQLGLDAKRTWIASASTWANTRKGIDLLPHAMNQLDCSGLGLLCWGGEPPTSDFPANLAVEFAGHIRNMDRSALMYAAADLFLCPSRADNLPNTVLEAMASGTPVIGSDVGGIPDMVRPGETGWLHENDNADSLAQKIREALSQRDRWPTLQRRAREVAVAEFDIEVNARNYRRLYEELLGGS